MNISFKRSSDSKLAGGTTAATKKLGADCARQLRARLADLRAAQKVGELLAGHPHPLRGDKKEEFALRLSGGQRIVFKAADDPIPTTAEGGIDWPRVTSIQIVFIGDYHE